MNKKIRTEIFKRAKGFCECGCRRAITFESGRADHFFGRAKAKETPATVWALAIFCDESKTANRPSAAYWNRRFWSHATRHGFAAERERVEARLAVLKQKGFAA